MSTPLKLNLRLPPEVREEAALLAEAQGLSLNAYLLRAVVNANGYWGPKLVRQARERQRTAQALRGEAAPARTMPMPGRKADTSIPVPKVGPNQPCPCGSGQKYKRCHGKPSAA